MIGREDCRGKTLGRPPALLRPFTSFLELGSTPSFYIAFQTPRGFTTRSGNDIRNILIFTKKIDENETAHDARGIKSNHPQ